MPDFEDFEDNEQKRKFLPLFVYKYAKKDINQSVVQIFCENNEKTLILLEQNENLQAFLEEFKKEHKNLVSSKNVAKEMLARIAKEIKQTEVTEDNANVLKELYSTRSRIRNDISQKTRKLTNLAKYALLKEISLQNNLQFSREKLAIFSRNLFKTSIKEKDLELLISEIGMIDNPIKLKEKVAVGYTVSVNDDEHEYDSDDAHEDDDNEEKEDFQEVYGNVEITLKNNELFDYLIKNHLILPDFKNFFESIRDEKIMVDFMTEAEVEDFSIKM